MELIGRMDENGRMWFRVTVKGNRGETEVEAMIDTGFTHSFSLPVTIAATLGLELTGFIPLELADGREQMFFTFAANVIVGDLEAPVDIIVTERGAPLLGTALLQTLEANFSARFLDGTVTLSVQEA
ncbi:MAG: hypothetical protein N3B10_00820 [Armatimonadetes bacterium]|nr:hypothetical protein [Armatimonadota bacterium]